MRSAWGLLTVLSLVCHTEPRCSPTSYYKNCWIRRFPGIFIDVEESQRRGAQLLERYAEESALKCSRTCCLTRNFSCNLAIFHYDTSPDAVNCFHLHCPTLESCILSNRGNVVLYNVTKGVDPDLLVFGKYFTSNVRVLPHHYGRVNASEPLPSDKRHFIHPPPPAAPPPTPAPTVKPRLTASRAPTTTITTTTTTTTTIQGTSRPSASPTNTAALSFTTEAPVTAGSREPPPAPPATFTTSPAPSFTSPASPSTENTEAAPAFPPTTARPSTSLPHHPTSTTTFPPTPIESSNRYPNNTAGSGEGGQGGGAEDTFEGLGPGWHAAAHTVLVVAVAVCVTVLLSCCCSILLVVSWRGQRKRMGRYRTSWRRKRGSTRLIKYVLVRENT